MPSRSRHANLVMPVRPFGANLTNPGAEATETPTGLGWAGLAAIPCPQMSVYHCGQCAFREIAGIPVTTALGRDEADPVHDTRLAMWSVGTYEDQYSKVDGDWNFSHVKIRWALQARNDIGWADALIQI